MLPEEKLPEEEQNITPQEEPQEEEFELSPEEATGFDGGPQSTGSFNRKRVLMVICAFFAVVICGGLLVNTLKPSKKKSASGNELSAANSSSDEFLSSLRTRALNRRDQEPEKTETPAQTEPAEPRLPPASFTRSPEVESVRSPPPQASPSSGPPPNTQQGNHFRSPLVPQVQGSLFSSSSPAPPPQQGANSAAQNYTYTPPSTDSRNPYEAQNDQKNKSTFYDSSNNGGALFNGRFIGDNAIWTGTIIPGVLETAINTDLPGNVLARVTQNIYDSQTGRKLLIPQGTLLLAKYNSSVSYAQRRVQIVWDTLIRPDGFQIDLEGANGVDRSGMSGQSGAVDEHWFEYAKAAGIVTLFSIANARMTETAARYSSDAQISNVAQANSQLVDQLGGNLVNRAMNIQPTLTVENGSLINIMLNKTLYLPPAVNYPAAQKYTLE